MGMHKYHLSELFEKPQIEKKNTNFRSWKKGKNWMFASALVASIIGGGTTMMTGASNASADTVNPSTTEKVAQTSTDNVPATTSEVAGGSIVATSNAEMSIGTSESATTSNVSAASIVSSTVTPIIKSTAVESSTVMPAIENSTASSVAEASVPAQPVSSTISTLEETGSTETNSNASVVTNQVTKTPTLITKDITVNKGQAFRQSAGFVEATDSTGKAVKTSDISITGVVNSNIAGTYYVLYSFVDVNGVKITGKAQVNVRDAIAPVTPISDSAKQNDVVSSSANIDTGMTLSQLASTASNADSTAANVNNQVNLGSMLSSMQNSLVAASLAGSDVSDSLTAMNSLASFATEVMSEASANEQLTSDELGQKLQQLVVKTKDDSNKAALDLINKFLSENGRILADAQASAAAAGDTSATASLQTVASLFATLRSAASTNDVDEMANAVILAAQTLSTGTTKVDTSFIDNILSTIGKSIGNVVGGANDLLNKITNFLTGFLGQTTQHDGSQITSDPLGTLKEILSSMTAGISSGYLTGVAAGIVSGIAYNLVSTGLVTIVQELYAWIPIVSWFTTGITSVAAGIVPVLGDFTGLVAGVIQYYDHVTKDYSVDGNVDTPVSGEIVGTIAGATIGVIAAIAIGAPLFTLPLAVVDLLLGIGSTIPILSNVLMPLAGLITGAAHELYVLPFSLIPLGLAILGGGIGAGIGAGLSVAGINFHLPNLPTLLNKLGIGDWLNNIGNIINGAGSVITNNLTVAKNGIFRAISGFKEATDSKGGEVDESKISIAGTVNTKIPGVYIMDYSFNDTNTGKAVHGYSQVTVTA